MEVMNDMLEVANDPTTVEIPDPETIDPWGQLPDETPRRPVDPELAIRPEGMGGLLETSLGVIA